MSVSSVGLNQSVGASGWRSTIRQAHQDFDQLFQSLQSGDLAAAQQAYNAFQQLQAGQTSSTATPTASVAATANPVATDWSALGQALQAGNLSSAQTALTQLETDAKTVWQSHLQQQALTAQSVYALMQGTQGAEPPPAATSAATTLQTDLTALSQALQSGDSTGAQTLLGKLIADLQTSAQSFASRLHHRHENLNTLMTAATAPTTTAASSPATAATSAASAS